MPKSALPVIHPDHPYNRHPYPLQTSPLGPAQINRQTAQSRYLEGGAVTGDSDMSSASPSPHAPGRCFCGREVDGLDGGIYCSVACARSDAFSSLCYKSAPEPTFAPPSSYRQPSSIASSASSSLSRNLSTSSTTSTATDITDGEWNASHYRRLALADLRREERKEERKRRRADTSVVSTSSSGSRVPELMGGGGHSRNASVASSVTSLSSAWSAGGLSRNASSASSVSASSSRRGHGGGVHVDAVIMEDDDEEWLANDATLRPILPAKKQHRRGGGGSRSGRKKKRLDSFGMGKDMRDVLEEIIQMEKGFIVDDEDRDAPPGLFTATFDRAPRTPSPMSVDKRASIVPMAPGAPARGHRSALSRPHLFAPQRPLSLIGLHQSSLSESHTALYLATASPIAAGRRSASPKLQSRKSLAFSPDEAGPAIGNPLFTLPLPSARFDSPGNLTPSRRRPNISPSAHHPAMGNWRFPSAASNADGATPKRPVQTSQPARRNAYETPVRPAPAIDTATTARIEPQLLWPPPAPPLAPALFPSSPATGTPDFPSTTPVQGVTAPSSGVRLGVLLGSMSPDEGMEVDVDDEDCASTAHGHAQREYLPVFLEAEGFAGSRRG